MKSILAYEQLLQTFAGLSVAESYTDLKLTVTAGKNPQLNVKTDSGVNHFAIQPDLYPSRKILERNRTDSKRSTLLLSPHIPKDLAKDFRSHKINHADLNGRLFLKTPNLLVDREPREKIHKGPVIESDWFSPKSSRIIRSLLSHPEKEWNQKELVERTCTSVGLVSRIVNGLTEERFLEKQTRKVRGNPSLYRLVDEEKLLELWQDADVWRKRVHIEEYSVLKAKPEDIARTALEAIGPENLAFTQWFAANLRYPYTTPPLVSAYVRKEGFFDSSFARKVDTGGNLWLITPDDEGVFFETRTVSGYRLVSDAQIYLDLRQAGLRGPEQAHALRTWKGFNR